MTARELRDTIAVRLSTLMHPEYAFVTAHDGQLIDGVRFGINPLDHIDISNDPDNWPYRYDDHRQLGIRNFVSATRTAFGYAELVLVPGLERGRILTIMDAKHSGQALKFNASLETPKP